MPETAALDHDGVPFFTGAPQLDPGQYIPIEHHVPEPMPDTPIGTQRPHKGDPPPPMPKPYTHNFYETELGRAKVAEHIHNTSQRYSTLDGFPETVAPTSLTGRRPTCSADFTPERVAAAVRWARNQPLDEWQAAMQFRTQAMQRGWFAVGSTNL